LNYRVRHETTYSYEDPVAVSHHILRLTPRSTDNQICKTSEIAISPRPPALATHTDYFGNVVTSFNLLEPHNALVVDVVSHLEVTAPTPVDFSASTPWERVAHLTDIDARQFIFDSKRSYFLPQLREYALVSFTPSRPVLEAVRDLTHRINQDFKFDSKATEVSTPVEVCFEKKRGVCQDFSHLQIACLRSLGLPSRYVSGYLRTLPPPGKPRLVGADASHAWLAAWDPEFGWIDFDPTNDCIPSEGHITVAWGRDYGDVSPIYGVLLGGADHTLDVGVDVVALDVPRDARAD
jgi:transglutaminase-like putative cysteine protease